jgi:hypothetical protein
MVSAAVRGNYYQEEFKHVKELLIFKITFTAVGMATLSPDILTSTWAKPEKRFRLYGDLHLEYYSIDDVLLYTISEEVMQIE